MPHADVMNPQEILDHHVVLNAKEVSAIVRVSVATLRAMVKAGSFPKPLDSRERVPMRWCAAVVKRWLEEGSSNG